jgi:hypothetical protein
MIHNNENYAGTIVPTLLAFGKGDIAVMPAISSDGYAQVMFKNDEPHQINVEVPGYPVGKILNDIEPEVMMVFDKVESIEVVIWALEKAKIDLLHLQRQA